jgi:hypothetical protein
VTVNLGQLSIDGYWAGVAPSQDETDEGGVREGNSALPQSSGGSLDLGDVQAGLGRIGP